MTGLRSRISRVGSSDSGDVVLGWLTKLVVGLSICGLVLFDGISVATTKLTVQDQAAGAASAASAVYQRTSDTQAAYTAAVDSALEADVHNDVPVGLFSVTRDGTATVAVQRTAETLVVGKVGWIADWAEASATATARDVV